MAVVTFRFSSWVFRRSKLSQIFLRPLTWSMQFYTRAFLGIQISPAADIGPGLYIGHFGGVIISGRAKIGANVSLSQGVTIGSSLGPNAQAPIIGNRVYIGPGAVLYGGISIGDGAKIGANTVIHKDIPPNRIAVAWPGFKLLDGS